jgi:hypothetical protein
MKKTTEDKKNSFTATLMKSKQGVSHTVEAQTDAL